MESFMNNNEQKPNISNLFLFTNLNKNKKKIFPLLIFNYLIIPVIPASFLNLLPFRPLLFKTSKFPTQLHLPFLQTYLFFLIQNPIVQSAIFLFLPSNIFVAFVKTVLYAIYVNNATTIQ